MLYKKIIYFDMDNVLVDFKSAFNKIEPDLLRKFDGQFDEIPGIFSLMEPLEGALEAYKTLSTKFDTYILSTAPWENSSAWSDKNKWVKRYLGKSAYKRLILSHNKHLNIGDYLIDDRTANGAGQFTGEHIHFGSPQFPKWQSVLDYLL
ncbi:MAG: 5' nucleotidase, NT5C type [Pseudomonadales bacterium]